MFAKILQPSDGSSYALKAAEYGSDIARKYESQVTLLYIVEMPPVAGIPPGEEYSTHMRQGLTANGYEALKLTREICERAGVQAVEEIIFGSAVPDILRYAIEGEFDLIVIGSRGAGSNAIEQILIGSVAEGILHGAPCPVLMVRPL